MKRALFSTLLILSVCCILCSCMLTMTSQMLNEEKFEKDEIDRPEEITVTEEPEEVYFEEFAVNVVSENEPFSVSFSGYEGGTVYYTLDGTFPYDGDYILGKELENPEKLVLPAGKTWLRAVCVDEDGNKSSVVSENFEVSRLCVNKNTSLIGYNNYLEFAVLGGEITEYVSIYNRFTEEYSKKSYVGDIQKIVTGVQESSLKNEIGSENYDKIMNTVSADVAASIANEVNIDELYVYVRNKGYTQPYFYSFIDGKPYKEDEDCGIYLNAKSNEVASPAPDGGLYSIEGTAFDAGDFILCCEKSGEDFYLRKYYKDERESETLLCSASDVGTLYPTAVLGQYAFITSENKDKYIYDMENQQFAQNTLLEKYDATEFLGVVPNAFYGKKYEGRGYVAKRIPYEEIATLFTVE
ncbi:MAG: chitobiase/beta-hexosaminidase C-terminal domain-containing protein [Clostridia bacterium]|nr:chitobiase/beta-hexosaminidase C-terminal domain-containing protein [Clostridia bacterium]